MSIFDRLANVPVSPKEFRKMYVTFIKNRGATEAELEASAIAMQHSRTMQNKTYDKQEQIVKSAPTLSFNEKVFKEVWSQENNLIAPKFTPKPSPSTAEQFTRLKLSRIQVAEEVNRLRQMNMSQEQIIQFLWDATPRARKKYQSAIAELEELTKL